MLKNDYLVAKIGIDTAENEVSTVADEWTKTVETQEMSRLSCVARTGRARPRLPSYRRYTLAAGLGGGGVSRGTPTPQIGKSKL